jgi:hypothetical protein
MGTWEWDITTGQVIWSETLEAIHARPGTFQAPMQPITPTFILRIVSVVGTITTTLTVGSDHYITYRIVPLMAVRWVEGRGCSFR